MNAEITRRQAKIIPLLLTMPVESACGQAKIAKPRIYKWLKQEKFREALRKAQDEVFSDAIGRIKAGVSKAVTKLVALIDSPDETISVRACGMVIEHAAKLVLTDDIERRLALLEKASEARPYRN